MSAKDVISRANIVVGVVTNKTGKVLILERIRKENANDGSGKRLSWVFPGGKIDGDESPADAVVREVQLETGSRVTANKLISEQDHPQFNVHIKYYACEISDPRTTPIHDVHEVAQVKWVDKNAIRDFFVTDLDASVAKFLGI